MSIIVWNGLYSPIWNHVLKKENTCWLNFPVIKNTIKWIAFENAYESSIIFQPLLYANVPAESPYYTPTFFKSDILNIMGEWSNPIKKTWCVNFMYIGRISPLISFWYKSAFFSLGWYCRKNLNVFFSYSNASDVSKGSML